MPSQESIDRLHVVNQIRDLLKESTSSLSDAGIIEVLLFGSVGKGTARTDSDIDLCFIHHSIDQDDFEEFSNKLNIMRSVVSTALSKCEKKLTFHPPQSGQDQDVVHITLQPANDEIDKSGKPGYAVDSLSLWKPQT